MALDIQRTRRTSFLYILTRRCWRLLSCCWNKKKTHLTAKNAWTHNSQNHLKADASIFPPIIITISSVSLMSGSNPMLRPGDDSSNYQLSNYQLSNYQLSNYYLPNYQIKLLTVQQSSINYRSNNYPNINKICEPKRHIPTF